MARAAKVCAQPGCTEITTTSHCPEHTQAHNWRRRTPGEADARGWAWTKLRSQVLERDNHTCVQCPRPATEVDHIVPRSVDPARAFDLDNLRSLCKPCHAAVTRKQRRSRRTSQDNPG